MDLARALGRLREQAPLVQCITNMVTVNDCANIILAGRGSPSMAQDVREVEESVRGVQALVCNMGAIEHVDSMLLDGQNVTGSGVDGVAVVSAIFAADDPGRATAELLALAKDMVQAHG